MRIVFIRHAEPDYSIDSLTEKGWREAKLLAKRVSRWDVDRFYCSPLGRAIDTASCTLDIVKKEATVYPFLREFDGHVVNPANGYDHVCWDLMPDYWTKNELMYDRDKWPLDEIMLGSRTDINAEYKKVISGLDGILKEYGYVRKDRYYVTEKGSDKTIVIFCHLGVTMVMMSYLLGLSAPVLWHGFYLAPSSVTILDTEERIEGMAYFRCEVMGDTSHLLMGNEPISNSGFFAEAIRETPWGN